MKMRCPYCGHEISNESYCKACLNPVSWAKAFYRKSDLYYNAGYKAAKCRDLSMAEKYLVKAISANKYHVEARNLLGLVYHETGRIGEALKQWIISSSLYKEDNPAVDYIKSVQKEPKKLEHYNEAIRLYNTALGYVRQKNTDMAIIRLKKAVSLSQKFVKARVLLSLCYMYDKQYGKAKEMLRKTLMIDAGEKDALKYYYELMKEDNEPVENTRIEYQAKTNKTKSIEPSAILDRQAILSRSILNFVLGVVAVVIIYTYLIIPSKLDYYKGQITTMSQTEDELKGRLSELTTQYDEQVKGLEEAKTKLENEVSQYEMQIGILSQKEKLASAQSLMKQGDYVAAAEKIYNVASTQLDETDLAIYNDIKPAIYVEANNRIYNEGIGAYNSGDYMAAINHFETILLYEPEERMTRKTLYYLGCSEMENGSIDNAKKYFNKLISEYEGSYEADQAQRQLDNLAI